MSRFCGKCDVWDSLVMIREMNDDSDWSKVEIRQYERNGDEKKLEIKSLKDLLPYAAHLIAMSYGNQDGTYTAIISSDSYVDREEAESFEYALKHFKNRYRSCKRKKVPFDVETEAKKYSFSNDEIYLELAKRVNEHPTSAKIDGLHRPIYNYYREELVKEMVKYGYTEEQANEWVFNHNKTW